MLPATATENNLSLELIPPDSDQPIRVVGTPQNPEWVAADVCRALGIKNVSHAVSRLKDSEKGIVSSDTPGGVQELLTVTEAGLYRLIFRSDKPEAERFQTWVFSEVLPAIRQFGCYPPPAVPIDPTAMMLRQMANQWEAHQQLQLRQQQMEAEQQALTHRVGTVEARLSNLNGDTGYRTLVGYAREQGFLMPQKDAIRHGKALAKIHKERGVRIGTVADERFGAVNSYRCDILREYFQALG